MERKKYLRVDHKDDSAGVAQFLSQAELLTSLKKVDLPGAIEQLEAEKRVLTDICEICIHHFN